MQNFILPLTAPRHICIIASEVRTNQTTHPDTLPFRYWRWTMPRHTRHRERVEEKWQQLTKIRGLREKQNEKTFGRSQSQL